MCTSQPPSTAMIPMSFTIASSFFFFQAEDGIRDLTVTGVQTCALPISITLRTSTGRWVSLMRRGDMLYGVALDQVSGYRILISVEKDTGVLANPPSAQSGQ